MKTTTITTTNKRIEANTKAEAWQKVREIFPTDYEIDFHSTERAGYAVYRSTADGHYYDYICDLGDRLEVNLSNGKTVNVWFSDLYWKAIENDELRHQVADLKETVKDLKQARDDYKEAYEIVLENEKSLVNEIKALEAEIAELKKNGYSLMNDLIA